jgi:hypothetical protein
MKGNNELACMHRERARMRIFTIRYSQRRNQEVPWEKTNWYKINEFRV